MGQGLIELFAIGQGLTEVVVGFGVVRIEFQRLLIMGNGFVVPATIGQSQAEIVSGLRRSRD